jgi:hypothetical protein
LGNLVVKFEKINADFLHGSMVNQLHRRVFEASQTFIGNLYLLESYFEGTTG